MATTSSPRRQTCDEIRDEVRRLLSSPAGIEKVRERRVKAKAMADGLRKMETARRVGPRHQARRRGTVFAVTQGDLIGTRRGLTIHVEVNGCRVGMLTIDSEGRSVFKPQREEGAWSWSHDRGEGELVKQYLQAKVLEANESPERARQGLLVHAMFGSKPKHHLLRYLQPVMPARCMMEIPAPVGASQKDLKLATGNIDILVRRGRGRSGSLAVCELKSPKANAHVYDVLRQAIRYAAALEIEVNGTNDGLLEPADLAVYQCLFGTHAKRLRFGAMAAVYARAGEDHRADHRAVDRALDALRWLTPGAHDWLRVLLYSEGDDRVPIPKRLMPP